MCSSGEPYQITLPDVVLAAVTSTMEDEDGVRQPLAFTEHALEVYLEAKHGIERSPYLANTIKYLLKEGALHEYKRSGKYFLTMPRRSMEAFERMNGYYPDVIEVG